MKTRLVFWGNKEDEGKVLLGLSLNEEENNIDVYVFKEENLTEDFVNAMHNMWRNGDELELVVHERFVTPLTISDRILPEEYQIDREDILKRAQTEWNFIVLSSKMYHAYKNELEEIKERIDRIGKFDHDIWEELKNFWSKVQDQVREKNLFREHADSIRTFTNEIFGELKKMRRELDKEFAEISEKHKAKYHQKLEELENKVQEGLSIQPIFEELKRVQRNFKNTRFTKEHRSEVWKRLDGLFKTIKEKKFGKSAGQGSSPLDRVNRRYDGLVNAIEKMERSIQRDRKDLRFQKDRVERAEGSLETQIRAAKIKMIEERIISKEDKLAEMHKTRETLERKMEAIKERMARDEEKKKIEDAKKEVKAKIAEEIEEAKKAREGDEKISEAVEAIKDTVQKTGSSVVEEVEEGFEDVVDTIKAIASVIEDRAEKFIHSFSTPEKSSEEE